MCIYVYSVTFSEVTIVVSRNNHFIKLNFTNGNKCHIHQQGHLLEKFKSAFGVKFNSIYIVSGHCSGEASCDWAGLGLIHDSLKTGAHLKLTNANYSFRC